MFDVNTGAIDYGVVTLRRGETREDFLATDPGSSAQVIVENQGWITYQFSPDQKVFFAVQFKSDLIEQVYIACALEGNDPNPWSVESEAARKSVHDQMLRKEIGAPPYRFGWGTIESVTDPRSGASIIVYYK